MSIFCTRQLVQFESEKKTVTLTFLLLLPMYIPVQEIIYVFHSFSRER